MLENWSQRYYSHNSNIKCVYLTIKCIGFKSFHYAINLDVVSSFVVFNDFDFMFLLLVGIDEIIFFFKKKKKTYKLISSHLCFTSSIQVGWEH